MPASSGGSSSSASNTPASRTRFELLLEAQKKVSHLEAEKLALAEENATFYERPLGLHDAYVEYLEWSSVPALT